MNCRWFDNVKFYSQVLAVPEHRGKCEYKPSFRMALFGYINKIIQFVFELLCVKCRTAAASTLFIKEITSIYIYISITDVKAIFDVQNIQNKKKNLVRATN